MFKLDEPSAIGPSYIRSALEMNAKAKIPLDSIETAHRALDALPEHRPEALTKTQAIQRLIVPIRATQSKGYSLAAIGKVLTDCGIPITTGALRAYVSEASANAEGKKKRKAKRLTKATKEPQPRAIKSSPLAAAVQAVEPAAKRGDAGAARSVDLDWDPAARSEKVVPLPAGASRPASYVRPDSKDI